MPDPAQIPSSPAIVLPVLGALLFLLLRWLLIGGESALRAVGEESARELAEHKRQGRALLFLKVRPELFHSGLRTGMAFSVIALGACFSVLSLEWSRAADFSPEIAIAIAAFAVWVLTVAGDPLPRSLAARWPEKWAMKTALALVPACRLFAFPVRLAGKLTVLILKPFDVPLRFSLPPPALDDIERMLTQTHEEGAPEPALVRSLFDFGERTAKEIMVPRTDLSALSIDTPSEEVVRMFIEEGHTRMPVYKGTLDTISGLVHVKDVLPLLGHPEQIVLANLMRPVMFVPWNRPASHVMRDMQHQSQHLAVVLDEYGGVAGIVTLEDVVEELVGDIRDEFDEEPPEILSASEGVSLVRAEMRVSRFNEFFDADVPEEGGYETLAGFLASLSGDIPEAGARFFVSGFELEVARREPRRVLEIKVSRIATEEEGGEEQD